MREGICLGGMSAVQKWREVRWIVSQDNQMDPDDPTFRPLLVRLIHDAGETCDLRSVPSVVSRACLPSRVWAQDLAEAQSLGALSCDEVTTVLLGSAAGRRYLHGIACSVFGSPLPEGSLRELMPGILLPSPELTAVLAASTMGLIDLAVYVSELCGLYTLAPEDPQGFVASPAVMSLSGLESWCLELEGLCRTGNVRVPLGLGRVKRASSLAFERCASPAEVTCAVLLCSPGRVGGYGLPRPEMNGLVEIGDVRYACDMLWRNERLALEYQGSVHDGSTVSAVDRKKAVALSGLGYRVLQIGRQDIASLPRLDAVARAASLALGKTWRSPTEAFRARQTELRRVLLASW